MTFLHCSKVFSKTFLSCLLLAFLNQIHYDVISKSTEFEIKLPPPVLFLIPSLGATIVLIFCTPASPLTKPYNILLGQSIAGVVGVSTRLLFTLSKLPSQYDPIHVSLSLAITTSLMVFFEAIHPPAGNLFY